MKYPRMDWGTMEAVVNKLGGMEGVKKFLRGELAVSPPLPSWYERDNVIYFNVISEGVEGVDWITRLEGKGFRVGDGAKQVLRSSDFKPTKGVMTEVAVLRGDLYSEDNDRITKNICYMAAQRGLTMPKAEIACLIREKFTDEEVKAMGFRWIVAMHEPVEGFNKFPYLLDVNRDAGGRWLTAYNGKPDHRWGHDYGFAFAVSEMRLAAFM